MRTLLNALAAASGFLSAVSAQNARIYLPDLSPSDIVAATHSAPFEPLAARLLFAQRLGLAQFHTLGGVEEETLQTLNVLTGHAQNTFSAPKPRLLLFVDNVLSRNALQTSCTELKWNSGVDIATAPSFDANTNLLQTFVDQARYSGQLAIKTPHTLEHEQFLHRSFEQLSNSVVTYNVSIHAGIAIARIYAAEGGRVNSESTICDALNSLVTAVNSQRYTVTIAVFFSDNDRPNGLSKRDVDEWAMSGALEASRRQHQGPVDNYSGAENAVNAGIEPFTTPTSSALPSASVSPPSGVLPNQFPSKDSCESATNSCTGRGSCEAQWTYTEDGDEKKAYACVCKPEKRTNADGGIKTIRWGGPACQKKDIGMEFWLLGGFTILFITILTWALSMLYAMGQEDLPSVIGAGVAGPRAK